MRPRVDHATLPVVVRQEGIGAHAVEGELQHLHTGQAEAVPQPLHGGGDHPQVLGDERQAAQFPAQRSQEVGPRALDPAPALCSGFPRRHRPAGLEAAEVVEAHQVHQGEGRVRALQPPAVTGGRQALPVVEGVAPQLPGGAEVVRGHAGHHLRLPCGGEAEQLLVGPHVRAVVGHEDRDVADQADSLLRGQALERAPLAEEEELLELLGADLLHQLPARPLEGRRFAPGQLGGPAVPHVQPALPEAALQGHEQGEVREPGAGGLAEGFKARPVPRAGAPAPPGGV